MYKEVHALAIVLFLFVVCFNLRCNCIAASESSQNSLSLIISWLHGAIVHILSRNVVYPIWSVCIPIHFVWNGNSCRSHNAVRLCSDLRSLTSQNAMLLRHWWRNSKVGGGIMEQRGIMEHFHFKMSQGRTKGNRGFSSIMCLNWT